MIVALYIILVIFLLGLFFIFGLIGKYSFDILKLNIEIDGLSAKVSDSIKGRAIIQSEFERIIKNKKKPLLIKHKELAIKKRFLIDLISPTMLIVAVITLMFNVVVFYQNVATNNNLNRPYIEINTSRIKELDISRVNPDEIIERYEKSLPIPYINYLNFSISNVGKLPARYSIDVSEFREVGMTEIIPQENDNGVIFPGQTVAITYYIKGETNSEKYIEESKEEVERTQGLINGDDTKAYKIRVNYDYLQNNDNLNFETVVAERVIEKGGDLPGESFGGILTGYSREWFIVEAK